MKKQGTLIFTFLVACFATLPAFILAQGETLPDFSAVVDALRSGHRIAVVIDYAKCDLFTDGKMQERMPDISGGMTMDAWEYFSAGSVHNPQAFLVFSTSKLIRNPIGKGMVYNYVKVKIRDNDSVTVTAQYLRPGSYKAIMDEEFRGAICDGKNNGCIHFFK